jgi:spore coat protein U-like protein
MNSYATKHLSVIAFSGTMRLLMAVLMVCLLFGSAVAQDVAVATATATVLGTISVSATANLDFGQVLQGVETSTANNSADAAIFDISGEADKGMNLVLILPEYLTKTDGSSRMDIIFRATDASVDTTGASSPTTMAGSKGWQNTNPFSLPAGAIIGSSGTSIYLGGTVRPSANQPAGTYEGDVVLTVAYNGS